MRAAQESKTPIAKNGMLFFFQAGGGIRDGTVTGVQTCALPICLACPLPRVLPASPSWGCSSVSPPCSFGMHRSEERRVGKECRSRGSRYHDKKQSNKSSRNT